MSDDNSSSLDSAALERLHKLGGTELVHRMVGICLENMPKRMVEARDGYRADDLDAVERAVHSMRSSAGNVGANELMQLAEAAEDLAEKGTREGLEDQLAGIEAELVRVTTQLKALLEEGTA